jgi:glucose dehydrogenase
MTEKPVDQEPRQATSPTQPFPGGDSFLPNQFPSYGDATVPIPFFKTGGIFTAAWDRPALVFPGSGGGACWAADSFSQSTGYVYVGYGLISSVYSNAENGKDGYDRPAGELTAGGYAAVDPRTNTVVWRQPHTYALSHGCGFLSTAGRLLFRGAPDGIFTAMDDATGKELWTFQTGAGAMTAPCTYEAGGEQYVAIVAGGNWLPYKDCPRGDHLWAFKLSGTLPPAATPARHPPQRQPENADARCHREFHRHARPRVEQHDEHPG